MAIQWHTAGQRHRRVGVIEASVHIPGYHIVRRIGDGGMSVVYLAMQESLKRHVALKVMRARDEITDPVAERFIHEAETIAQLDHPNIVGIYDVGQAPDGSVYYAMPFLDHGDLRAYRYEGRDGDLVELMVTLCDGLAYAHAQKVVHRDIKPENVMFDKFGAPQIADFGIALTESNRRWTKEGQVIGSVDYMSPEQCQARAVDARSDIYAVGIMIWEILTGDVPFHADDEMGVMVAHVSAPLPELPWEVRHWQPLLRRCLAKDPDQRYRSIEALRSALDRIPLSAGGQQLTRLRVTVADWWRRWRRRLLLGALVAMFLTTVGLAVHFWRLASRPPSTAPGPAAAATETSPVAIDSSGNSRADTASATAAGTVGDDEEALGAVAEEDGETAAAAIDEELPPPEPPPAISADEALTLVEEAVARIEIDRLTRPAEDNAADRLVRVLEVYPEHPQALDALAAMNLRYRQLTRAALETGDYAVATAYVDSLARTWERARVPTDRFPLITASIAESVALRAGREIDRLDRFSAGAALAVLDALPVHGAVEGLRERVDAVPGAGDRLVDSQGEDTIFVPPRLERPDGTLRDASAGFAIMGEEVTVAAFRRFTEERGWEAAGCRSRGEAPSLIRPRSWREPGFDQNDDHPVVCVSWNDAVAFAEWLSARSGRLYRLPTSAEWNHAAWIGHESNTACETGNVAGGETAHFVATPLTCNDGVEFTRAGGRFQANRLGISDLRGNVREWVQDCAPSDTGFDEFLDRLKLKEADPCDRRAVRGTAWLDGRGESMARSIHYEPAGAARSYIGFRVVRDLIAEREREEARRRP